MKVDWHEEALRRLTDEEIDEVIDAFPKWSEPEPGEKVPKEPSDPVVKEAA